MGTHPIFESDFDCLTEMRGLTRLVKPVRNSVRTSYQLESSQRKVYVDERGQSFTFYQMALIVFLCPQVPFYCKRKLGDKYANYGQNGAWTTEGRKRFSE